MAVLLFAIVKGDVPGAVMGAAAGLFADAFSVGVFGISGFAYTAAGFLSGWVSRRINVMTFLRSFVFLTGLAVLALGLRLGSEHGRPGRSDPLAEGCPAPPARWPPAWPGPRPSPCSAASGGIVYGEKIYEDLSLLRKRALLVRAAITAAFAVLAFFYWKIQVLDHVKHRAQAEANRTREIVVPAPRGILTDRGGKLILADNRASFKASLIRENTKDLEGSIAAAARAAPARAVRHPGATRQVRLRAGLPAYRGQGRADHGGGAR